MSNGIATVFSAAVLVVSLGGCDIAAAPRLAEAPATTALLPKARYHVDLARNRVWFLSHEGLVLFDPSRSERITLSLPDWVSVAPHYGCLPDLTLGPRGEVVITSNALPMLWQIDPDTLAVSVHRPVLDADGDKDIGFSGLVYSQEHEAFFAASYSHGSLWKIDPRFERARKVSLSAAIPGACGLALRGLGQRSQGSKLIGLCASTAHGGWRVNFAPDGRSAYVGAVSCTTSLLAQTNLR
jgi:hypothetical protein